MNKKAALLLGAALSTGCAKQGEGLNLFKKDACEAIYAAPDQDLGAVLIGQCPAIEGDRKMARLTIQAVADSVDDVKDKTCEAVKDTDTAIAAARHEEAVIQKVNTVDKAGNMIIGLRNRVTAIRNKDLTNVDDVTSLRSEAEDISLALKGTVEPLITSVHKKKGKRMVLADVEVDEEDARVGAITDAINGALGGTLNCSAVAEYVDEHGTFPPKGLTLATPIELDEEPAEDATATAEEVDTDAKTTAEKVLLVQKIDDPQAARRDLWERVAELEAAIDEVEALRLEALEAMTTRNEELSEAY